MVKSKGEEGEIILMHYAKYHTLWKTKPNFSKFNSVWHRLKYVNMCWHLAVLWIAWIQPFKNNVRIIIKYTIFITIYRMMYWEQWKYEPSFFFSQVTGCHKKKVVKFVVNLTFLIIVY